jgi:trehalose 6-phosphate synthase
MPERVTSMMEGDSKMSVPPFTTTTTWQKTALRDLCARRLQNFNLLIASNRGPVEFLREGENIASHRGQGGLVTAMTSMVESVDATWVASALSCVDRQMAATDEGRHQVYLNDHEITVSLIAPGLEEYHRYYDDISNSVLWFLQHNMLNAPIHPTFDQALWDAWEHGYVKVNRLFAERLADEASRSEKAPLFMIHDYHLYLVPGLLRAYRPDALIQHFTHIAWPSPDQWRQLPPSVREPILQSLLGCDVVGFHCPRYAFNFLLSCQELLGLAIDWDQRTVSFEGRVVRVNDYPISIDPDSLWAFSEGPQVLEAESLLMNDRPLSMILQVARTDPSKNILRSFYAFEHFLQQYPEWLERVQFLGLLPTSRQTTEMYKEYLDELCQVADRINTEYGNTTWEPISLFLENDYARAIAAMKHYDVLVVNSIADGMNLVAKEGPIVNRQAGVLVISEATGATEELGDDALVVNPFDLVGMADAFYEALSLSPATRKAASAGLRRRIGENTIFRWATDQLADLVPALAKPALMSLLTPASERIAQLPTPNSEVSG